MFLVLLLSGLFLSPLKAQVVINEFSASNLEDFTDNYQMGLWRNDFCSLRLCFLPQFSCIGMGFVAVPDLTADRIKKATFEIEIAKERFAAQGSLRALYDPSSSRMKI